MRNRITRRRWFTLFASMLIAGLIFTAGSFSANRQQPKKLSQDEQERVRRVFKPAKDLLEQKGVPFEAEILLDADWRAKLDPIFARMPEMQVERRLGKELRGVQLADVLYLPEKV